MFRIGEFSQIAQVPTSQLRYYDEIGLLQPAQIDEWTNYRYYSITQLPRLNRIPGPRIRTRLSAPGSPFWSG